MTNENNSPIGARVMESVSPSVIGAYLADRAVPGCMLSSLHGPQQSPTQVGMDQLETEGAPRAQDK